MRGPITLLSLLSAAVVAAAPPVVTLPPEVSGEPSSFVMIRAKVDGATTVKFVPIDTGLSVFPSGMLKSEDTTVVTAPKAGRYRVLAYSGNADGPSEPAMTVVVVVGGSSVAPPPDKPTDPVKPPPPATKLHFMVVRPPGPVSPTVETSLNLPAWKEVTASGHTVGDLPFDLLSADAQTKLTGKSLPLVAVWEYTPSKRIRLTDRPTKPLPTTDAAVRELLK
jgi:hypothetical protein